MSQRHAGRQNVTLGDEEGRRTGRQRTRAKRARKSWRRAEGRGGREEARGSYVATAGEQEKGRKRKEKSSGSHLPAHIFGRRSDGAGHRPSSRRIRRSLLRTFFGKPDHSSALPCHAQTSCISSILFHFLRDRSSISHKLEQSSLHLNKMKEIKRKKRDSDSIGRRDNPGIVIHLGSSLRRVLGGPVRLCCLSLSLFIPPTETRKAY